MSEARIIEIHVLKNEEGFALKTMQIGRSALKYIKFKHE